MTIKTFILSAAIMPAIMMQGANGRYVGGDISLLPEYEAAGAIYKDFNGEPIAELLPYLRDNGMNAMRVRLFVNPEDYKGADKDPNACQDLDYIIPLCKRIKEAGFALLLDFHYSDTWADPAKQWTPDAWKNLDDDELCGRIYEYTKETLGSLKKEDIVPDFIQPGNEISFGMLWGAYGSDEKDLKKTFINSDANWKRLGLLLDNAVKACKEECPDARIVIHTERVGDIEVQDNFYRRMDSLGVHYDIIGLSYYPYFHGDIHTLDRSLSSLEVDFPDKDIMIVETGYPYKWEVPGTTQEVDYPYSEEGQDEFAKALVACLESHPNVTGLFWWWLEYNAYNTDLSGWYNAPLFDSTTGKICQAFKTICSFSGEDSGVEDIGHVKYDNPGVWYDIRGNRVAYPENGIFIKDGKKFIIGRRDE
ncbi:MAG: arabinogalactan endo-1,4-beta-galactosidase [Muribaculaceae bacterium]|nr:arabinogalactan endo-1,4-beta-galactosidase [Muribaculaceae bacterium]